MSTPLECPYCLESLVRSALPSHLLNDCPLVPMPCPHSIHGCPALIPRNLVQDHLEVACPFEPLKEFFGRYDDRVTEVESENWQLKKRIEMLESGVQEMGAVLNAIKKGLGEYYVGPSSSAATTASPTTAIHSISAPSMSTGTVSSTEEARHGPSSLLLALPSDTPHSPRSITDTLPHMAPTSITIPRQLSQINSSLGSLTLSLAALDNRLSTSLSTETMRLQEELGILRGSMHGSRMQSHFILQEVNRVTEGLNFLSNQAGLNNVISLAMGRRGDDGSAGSGSDDELSPRFFNSHQPFNSQPPPPMFGPGPQNGFRNAVPPLATMLLAGSNNSFGNVGGIFPGNGLTIGNGMRPRRFSQQQETKL